MRLAGWGGMRWGNWCRYDPILTAIKISCVMACPSCGSGEYLHNEDGNEQNFCGQCGQAIEWR